MAIRLYHLAHELRVPSSDLLKTLRGGGVQVPSVMTVLDDEKAAQARRVAAGEETVEKPSKRSPSDALEIKLPPPVVPAPARPARVGVDRGLGPAQFTGPIDNVLNAQQEQIETREAALAGKTTSSAAKTSTPGARFPSRCRSR